MRALSRHWEEEGAGLRCDVDAEDGVNLLLSYILMQLAVMLLKGCMETLQSVYHIYHAVN
jgi:hypothetical protein